MQSQTAVVMPVFHEDVDGVETRILLTWGSIQKVGLESHCDFFLLSDSSDPEFLWKEDAAIEKMQFLFSASGNESQIHLVRRPDRINFKVGNIAHFLETIGHKYDFMLVLDADSVMSGETIKRLILRMQFQPDLGILQTVILPVQAFTPFAKAMQFSISRCMPMFGRGLYWFLGRDSIYWGHNVLIRIAPFMEYCNLPILPGKPPRGGRIMSQDIVEAALIGSEGWAVEWDVTSNGSFDELPANMLTYAKRDRRWCQGNFQHFWLIFGDRFRFGHRLYFANGIMAYASGPLFLVLLTIGFIQGIRGRAYKYDSIMAWSFLVCFLSMLLLPKVLGFYEACRQGKKPFKEFLSTLLEIGFSLLISPILFYLHTCFVIGIFTGRSVSWGSQSRDSNQPVSWHEAAKVFWIPTVFGVIWLFAGWKWTPTFLLYLVPILAGWIFSIPMAVWTSRIKAGATFSKFGLFETPFVLDGELKEEKYPAAAR